MLQISKLVWEFGEAVLGEMQPLKGDEIGERVRQEEKTVRADAQFLKPTKTANVAGKCVELKVDQPQLCQ